MHILVGSWESPCHQTCTFLMSTKHGKRILNGIKTVLGANVGSGHILQWDNFMSGQVCHQRRSENLFFLELLISELWPMECGLVFCTQRSGNRGWDSFSDLGFGHVAHQQWSKNLNLDLVQVSVHSIAMLSVNVLQDAEGRINSFPQCHALVALRRKARPALTLGFPGDSAMGARDQYCARSCSSPRSCWWPELCVPHHTLCLSCWHANPGRTHSCMGMNRFFQLWPRL